MTGVRIDQLANLDFEGFVAMTDARGEVEIIGEMRGPAPSMRPLRANDVRFLTAPVAGLGRSLLDECVS